VVPFLSMPSTRSMFLWTSRTGGGGRQVALTDVHCHVSRVRFNSIDMAPLSTSGGNLLRILDALQTRTQAAGKLQVRRRDQSQERRQLRRPSTRDSPTIFLSVFLKTATCSLL